MEVSKSPRFPNFAGISGHLLLAAHIPAWVVGMETETVDIYVDAIDSGGHQCQPLGEADS